jgi:hypothetical protein
MKKIIGAVTAIAIAILFLAGCQKESVLPGTANNDMLISNALAATPTDIQVYGVWHAGDDYCTWAKARTVTDFDAMNHWIIERSTNGGPSVNLVVLSFVNPLKLLNRTSDAGNLNGIPKGMTAEIINYFKTKGIRVMLSIGGITYTDFWNQALSQNASYLGKTAAKIADSLGVGIEIDYEENSSPNLAGLQAFIDAYRSVHPYDPSGSNHAARLTIDLAAGDRWLIAICRKATADWLRTDLPVLDYANAMVPARQPKSVKEATANWQEHVDGKPQYGPPIPPLAPAKFTGGLYLITGRTPSNECVNFSNSLQKGCATFVQSIMPNGAGTTSGMLGYMFWAAEKPSTRNTSTQPPNGCEGGIGAGATYFNIPIPMPPLRQQ